jgi:hypothetical protein
VPLRTGRRLISHLSRFQSAISRPLPASSCSSHTGELVFRRAQVIIGELSRPRDGDQIYGTVSDLLEHPAPMRLQG